MFFVFNELSIRNVATDDLTAHDWLDHFFDICYQASVRSKQKVYLLSTVKFSQIFFQQNTSFTKWIASLKDRDYQRRILLMITKESLKIGYPYYYYKDETCVGLGYAYENNLMSLSYAVEYWNYSELELKSEKFNKEGDVIVGNVFVNHIASLEHLNKHFPVRKFSHNPKHDRIILRSNKDEKVSILECSVDRAEYLLRNSIGENSSNDNKLYFYDTEVKKYIIFQRHDSGLNEYHGYHIDDENELPSVVKKKIESVLISNFH